MEQHSQPSDRTLYYLARITGLILLLATAAVFLFSAITKLIAFDPFVWNIMDAGIANMTVAGTIARLFIGLEILLGLFLLGHVYLRSFTYPAVIALLTVFTVYLFLLIGRQGDTGDCGCFGETWAMKPSQAILKNLVMIGIVSALVHLYPIRPYKQSIWVAAVAGMAALGTPFVVSPPGWNDRPEVMNEPIDLSPLYHSQNPENQPPAVELREGKHIVAFMSLTCKHCKKAAFLLQVIKRQHPDYPIYFVLNGPPELLNSFHEESHSARVPQILFRGPEFTQLAGPYVPAIYWINNSVIEGKSSFYQLNPEHMERWLKGP